MAAMFTLYVPDKVDSLNSQVSKLTAELTENMTARGTLESQLAQAQQEAASGATGKDGIGIEAGRRQ